MSVRPHYFQANPHRHSLSRHSSSATPNPDASHTSGIVRRTIISAYPPLTPEWPKTSTRQSNAYGDRQGRKATPARPRRSAQKAKFGKEGVAADEDGNRDGVKGGGQTGPHQMHPGNRMGRQGRRGRKCQDGLTSNDMRLYLSGVTIGSPSCVR